MSRVKINFPDLAPLFSCDLQIRISDINYGNHLANDKLVSYLHEVRILFLKHNRYSEFDIEGASLIQGDLMVKYKAEGFLGELIHCELFIDNLGTRSFDMLYRLSTMRNNENVIIAEAKVGLVFFDYTDRKTVDIPAAFLEKFAKRP